MFFWLQHGLTLIVAKDCAIVMGKQLDVSDEHYQLTTADALKTIVQKDTAKEQEMHFVSMDLNDSRGQ